MTVNLLTVSKSASRFADGQCYLPAEILPISASRFDESVNLLADLVTVSTSAARNTTPPFLPADLVSQSADSQ